MTAIQFAPEAPLIRGKTAAEDFFLQAVSADERVGTETLGSTTVRDMTWATVTPQTTIRKSDVRVVSVPAISPVFSSATPSVCQVDQAGRVSRVSDGVGGVLVTANNDTRRIDVSITTVPGELRYTNVTTFGAGSLRQHLWNQQQACLGGLTPGPAVQRAFAPGGGVNPDCLVRRSVAGYQRPPLDALDQLLTGGVANPQAFHPFRAWVSPHHFLTWYGHFTGAPTPTRRWVQEVCVEYSATPWTGALCRLLPGDVATAKLPPEPWQGASMGSYIAAWTRLSNVYLPGEQYWVQPVNMGSTNPAQPVGDPRRPWQRTTPEGVMATGGDSGSPIWTQINGHLVILSHVVMYAAAGGGGIGQSQYHQIIPQLNAALAELNASGTFTIQTVDLSGFGDF